MNITRAINNIHIPNKCFSNWEAMEDVPGGRYCRSCKKVVYDFTDKHTEDFQKIYEEQKGNICGRFRLSQTTFFNSQATWKRLLSACLVVFGYNLIWSELSAQTSDRATNGINEKQNPNPGPFLLGVAEAMPEYKYGKEEGMMKFLKENLKFPENCADGKAIVRFVVDSTGKVKNAEIMKSGFGAEANKEVLRVVYLLEFKPAQFSNKNISSNFTLPILFKRKD